MADQRIIKETADGHRMMVRAQTLFFDPDDNFTTAEAFFAALAAEQAGLVYGGNGFGEGGFGN